MPDEAKLISINDFRKKYSISDRVVTIPSTNDHFRVRPLNLLQKREIREANMRVKGEDIAGGAQGAQSILDVESYMVDTIIACTVEPNFTEHDKMWIMEELDGGVLQELYNEIDTPVKLADLADEKAAGNSQSASKVTQS